MGADKADDSKLKEAILSALRGSSDGKSMDVKELRKEALLSVQGDADDKSDKKAFKAATKALEKDGTITLGEDGVAKLTGKGKKKAKKANKRKGSDAEDVDGNGDDTDGKKKQRTGDDQAVDEDDGSPENEAEAEEDESTPEEEEKDDDPSKNVPTKNNPTGCTRLFVGNLPFKVDESSLNDFLSSSMTHVKWITDVETGKFYGSAFVEMKNSKVAGDAVSKKAGTKLMGRPIRLNFAPSRPGDVWPPKKRETSGNEQQRKRGGQAGGAGKTAMSEKPEGCLKLFIGNLNYQVGQEEVEKFFAAVGSDVKTVRFIHHKDSGDPKGCGYVEFWNTDACDKAATLNGKKLLGRPIRIDWTD